MGADAAEPAAPELGDIIDAGGVVMGTPLEFPNDAPLEAASRGAEFMIGAAPLSCGLSLLALSLEQPPRNAAITATVHSRR